MNRLAIAITLLSLTLGECGFHHGQRRHHRRHREEPFTYDKAKAAAGEVEKKCAEFCKLDAGMDADISSCLTECRTFCDTQLHHLDECIKAFVWDEHYNEKGGKKMVKAHDEKAPHPNHDCVSDPLVYVAGTAPDFDQLDTNGDGVIDGYEAEQFARRACIPDEMIMQIFQEADLNYDKKIEKDEWKSAGEDTVNEKVMDDALEDVSQGDDEYNTVQNPKITEFDYNKDGTLDKDEYHKVFDNELERRTDWTNKDIPKEATEKIEEKIGGAFNDIDMNKDGKIDGEEYTKKLPEPEGMGEELREAEVADEDEKEIEDLPRYGEDKPGAPAPAMFLQQQRS